MKTGDLARARCTAPGRAIIGRQSDTPLVLFVSALDNTLGVDELDPDGAPNDGSLPMPSDHDVQAAAEMARYLRR